VTVEREVRFAVFEIVLQLATHPEAMVGSDGDVAAVEEAVDIGSEKEAVIDSMCSAVSDGSNVGRLQYREGLLLRDRAPALVGVRDQDPEGTLAEARTDKDRFTEHGRLRFDRVVVSRI